LGRSAKSVAAGGNDCRKRRRISKRYANGSRRPSVPSAITRKVRPPADDDAPPSCA
jgi:hypothetical protein